MQSGQAALRDSMSGSYGIFAGAAGKDEIPYPGMEGAQRYWFAVQTRHRFEKKVAAQLDRKQCEVYLPLLTERHTWSDRQKVITVPLFPGYAFVHIDRSRASREAVLQTAGLFGFVNFGGHIEPVQPRQIEDLKLLLQQKGLFSAFPFVRSGQRARIRSGCLKGLEGILLQNEKGKLVISIDSIHRSLAISIEGYELELA
jgi:transcription antitermination factor NusG